MSLVGAGAYLPAASLLLEVLAVLMQHWVAFPFHMTTAAKIISTIFCRGLCFPGVFWFHRSPNLTRVHLLKGEYTLVTSGAFAYMRHPQYATIILTMPPLLIIWLGELLFILPWVLLVAIAHAFVRLEERGPAKAFGRECEKYRRRAPVLLPLKGTARRHVRANWA